VILYACVGERERRWGGVGGDSEKEERNEEDLSELHIYRF